MLVRLIYRWCVETFATGRVESGYLNGHQQPRGANSKSTNPTASLTTRSHSPQNPVIFARDDFSGLRLRREISRGWGRILSSAPVDVWIEETSARRHLAGHSSRQR